MKKVLLIFAFLLSIECFSQKSSITIKTGLTSSNVENYKNDGVIWGLDSVYTKPLTFPEVGLGYTFKPKNWLWFSIEPGLKIVGHRYYNMTGEIARRPVLCFNAPIVSTFNLANEKLTIALDLGFNPNFFITRTYNNSHFYPEIVIGPRLGYKVSNKISLELYYRYGEGLKPMFSDNPLTTNYISLQTRISLGK
jgi:hypothetical protein